VEVEVVPGTPIGIGSATAWIWGDANNDGDVNLFDILCAQDGSLGLFPTCTLYGDDQSPGVPDGLVDQFDIDAIVDAFGGSLYPDPDPCP